MKSVAQASIAPKDRSVSIAPVKSVPRTCSVCGCADHLTAVEGDLDPRGNKRIEHRVTIELRYLRQREDFTAHLQVRGWRYKLHQGRHAMERFVCRACLIATQEMGREFRLKRQKELGMQNHDPYYLAVCGE